MPNPLPATLTHVALLAHSFPPDGEAGVEQYTIRLAHSLVALGLRVSVICGRVRVGEPQNTVLREEVDGLSVYGLVQNWPYRDLPEAAVDPALDRSLDQLLSTLAPDLLAVQSLQGLSWGFLRVAAAQRVPVVLHLHDAFLSCPSGGQRLHPDGSLCLPVDPTRCGACFDAYRHKEGPLEKASRWAAAHLPSTIPPDSLHKAFGALPQKLRDGLRALNQRGARLTRAPSQTLQPPGVDPRVSDRAVAVSEALEHVTRVISPSQFLADSVLEDGFELANLVVIETGVPGAKVPLRPDAGQPLRLLFLGTWVQHKGPHILAAALRALTPEEASRVEARAVGPAPFPQYRDDVERLSAGRLEVSGPVPSSEVPGLLINHDVLIVPSIWAENAPLVALEARAMGRPVIASDLGGLVELIHEGVDGLRFPAGDAVALVTVLRRLLNEEGLLQRLHESVRPPTSEQAWASAMLRAWRET